MVSLTRLAEEWCADGVKRKLIYTLNPVTELSRASWRQARVLCVWYLLYMRRLKSWKSMSLFLSKNPSTEYLQQTQREEVRGGRRKCPDVVPEEEAGSTDEHQGSNWVSEKESTNWNYKPRTDINTVRAVAKGATIIPRSQTPASAPKDSQSCRPGGLEQTVTPLRRFTN